MVCVDSQTRELLEAVARWFEVQHQRSFNLPWPSGLHLGDAGFLVDDRGLYEAVLEYLEGCRLARPGGRFLVPTAEYGRSERHARYRAFCRHAGVPIALDPTARIGAQGRGFEAATNFVAQQRGGPHTMVILSGLSCVEDVGPLRRAALSARGGRHTMIVFSPADPGFVVETHGEAVDDLAEALEAVDVLEARQRLQAIEIALTPAGVKLVSCAPGEVITKVVQHMDRVA